MAESEARFDIFGRVILIVRVSPDGCMFRAVVACAVFDAFGERLATLCEFGALVLCFVFPQALALMGYKLYCFTPANGMTCCSRMR